MRDLAAEVLHFAAPERYPLMTRWMWDARVNTGVLREIWHGDDVDAVTHRRVGDGFATFVTLREELEEFLRGNGVFRDLPFYVDLLCAHVYAGYINDRGGHICAPISAAPPRTPWRTRAASSASTRSTPNPAAPGSS